MPRGDLQAEQDDGEAQDWRSEKSTPLRAACGAPAKLWTTTPMITDKIIGLSTDTPGMSRKREGDSGDAAGQGEARRQAGDARS